MLCHGAHNLDVCREPALLAGRHDATQRGSPLQNYVRQVEVGVAPAVFGQLVARFGVDDEGAGPSPRQHLSRSPTTRAVTADARRAPDGLPSPCPSPARMGTTDLDQHGRAASSA